MTGNRRGFSLIELLVVLLIIGTLAGIAIPNLQRALLRARAVDAMSDLNVVRVALENYRADENTWPPDQNRGTIPPGLDAYLPGGFDFNREDWILDYENFASGAGYVGVSVRTSDQDLGLMLFDLLGNNAFQSGPDGYTWVIAWVD